ncbi:MAG: metallophosphoesterase family protein [Candidatus Omnitrophota bacterium]
MRYAIFSDIHSNGEALEAVLEAFKKEDIDSYLCCGDLVGYAANPNECIELILNLALTIVAGNHDRAAVNLFSLNYFNPLAVQAMSWTIRSLTDKNRSLLQSLKLVYENEDLTLVHGTLNDPADFLYLFDTSDAEATFRLLGTGVCFIGHTHRPAIFSKDGHGNVRYQEDGFVHMAPHNKYIVNVGSVGQPRDGNPKASYCIYDSRKKEIRIKRVGYDMENARRKILDAGLPWFLGDRLLLGR